MRSTYRQLDWQFSKTVLAGIIGSLMLGAHAPSWAQQSTNTSNNDTSSKSATDDSKATAPNKSSEDVKLRITRSLMPLDNSEQKQERKDLPTFVRGEFINGRTDDFVNIKGNAELRQRGVNIKADDINYIFVDDLVQARGNVRLFSNGDIITGPALTFKLDSQTGSIESPEYSFARGETRGQSKLMTFLGEDRVRLQDSTYTSCRPGDDSWYVQAAQLDIDQTEEVGTARDAKLVFKGVPILFSPVLTFPTGRGRKSGFLSPTIGLTSRGGFDYTQPYYWNIAPNRDATFYPRLIANRGIMMGAEYRYLQTTYKGESTVEYLPNDRNFSGANRWSFQSKHQGVLPYNFSYAWNLNGASDFRYFGDLGRSISPVNANPLTKDAYISWGQGEWSAFGRITKYQTLQDPLAPLTPPYERAPQLQVNWDRPNANGIEGLDLRLNTDITRFSHPTLIRGTRAYAYPTASYTVRRPGWFVQPKLGWHVSRYNIDSYTQNGVTQAGYDVSRSLPIASVDAGMFFERNTEFFGSKATQTLEPRLYYLRVPFRDQNRIPTFDSGLTDFNFAQIFSENVFSGYDRIADANQLTAAVTTRWLDQDNGAERLRLTIGQRLYFNTQQVTLPGGSPRTDGRSDLLLAAGGQVTESISLDSTVQYNQYVRTAPRVGLNLRYQPEPFKRLNVSYRRIAGQLEQFDTSWQWPLTGNWYSIGRVNYSLRDKRLAEGVIGLEYDGGCWVARVVAQRYAVATQTTSSALFFQLELNGFSRLGSNPLDTLKRNIPGYRQINVVEQRPSDYKRYE